MRSSAAEQAAEGRARTDRPGGRGILVLKTRMLPHCPRVTADNVTVLLPVVYYPPTETPRVYHPGYTTLRTAATRPPRGPRRPAAYSRVGLGLRNAQSLVTAFTER